jgi:hypothetical protein
LQANRVLFACDPATSDSAARNFLLDTSSSTLSVKKKHADNSSFTYAYTEWKLTYRLFWVGGDPSKTTSGAKYGLLEQVQFALQESLDDSTEFGGFDSLIRQEFKYMSFISSPVGMEEEKFGQLVDTTMMLDDDEAREDQSSKMTDTLRSADGEMTGEGSVQPTLSPLEIALVSMLLLTVAAFATLLTLASRRRQWQEGAFDRQDCEIFFDERSVDTILSSNSINVYEHIEIMTRLHRFQNYNASVSL